MSDIFISYASEDKEKAGLLAKIFEQQDWSVWWDREIPPGRSFDEVIEEALDRSKSVVVLWSKASVSSRWVKAEARDGLDREILVPAMIEEAKVPLVFRSLQVARLSGWNGEMPHQEIDKLIKAVSTIVSHSEVEDNSGKKKSASKGKEVGKQLQDKIPVVSSPVFRPTSKEDLTEKSVKAMLKDKEFFDSDYNKSASGFSNDYKLQNGGKIVFDRASSLMWQQSGSDEYMNYEKAKTYIKKLNSDKVAGYSDWRLPTIEEAMSLMEPTKKNSGLYIDQVFDKKQRWIWTSDLKGASVAWVVSFCDVYCSGSSLYHVYVRAVR